MIQYTDFAALDIRSGTIVRSENFSRAQSPAYKLWVNFGEAIGVLQTSAQVTKNYDLDGLVGMRVMGCVNLGEKNIAGFTSQFLLLGFKDNNENISLPIIASSVPDGQKIC